MTQYPKSKNMIIDSAYKKTGDQLFGKSKSILIKDQLDLNVDKLNTIPGPKIQNLIRLDSVYQ